MSQCDVMEDFGLTRGDLKQFGFSSFIAELVDYLLPLEDPNKQVFELIFNYLNSLRENPRDIRHSFEIKILALSGFKPHFDSCVVCDSKISEKARFSHHKGGLLCPKCLYHDGLSEPVLPGSIATILYIEKSSWQNCLRLNMLKPVRSQLDKILNAFIYFHVGKILKTNKLIHEFLDL